MSLRVLCVTPFGPAGKGGIDRLYAYLRGPGPDDRMAGIDLRFARSRGGARGASWVLTSPLMLGALALQMARFRPQVVHINFATGGSLPRKFAVLRLAKLFGARTVVHFHGEFIEAEVAARTPAGRMFRAIACQADRVVALGTAHADAFRRIGVPPARVAILPNGIPDFAGDAVLPKPRGEPLRLLFAGLMTENKGLHVMIPALARFGAGTPRWHCTIAGNGQIERYARMVRDAGLTEHVTFPGWIDSAALHDLMRKADIVLLPSRTEGLPLSLIEGACAGAALIGTDVGNVRMIVRDGVNGALVPRTSEAIAEVLQALERDRARLADWQAASRRVYREAFTLTAFAAALRTIYRDAAASGA